jgi:hypothetical protein
MRFNPYGAQARRLPKAASSRYNDRSLEAIGQLAEESRGDPAGFTSPFTSSPLTS